MQDEKNKDTILDVSVSMRMWVQALDSLCGLRTGIAVSCCIGHRSAQIWPWHRLAAVALIQPPAWELPYDLGAALKKKKKKKRIILYNSFFIYFC